MFPRGLGWMVPASRPGAGLPEYERRWRSSMVAAVAGLGVRTLWFELSGGSVRGWSEIVRELGAVTGSPPSTVLSLPPSARSGPEDGLEGARRLASGLTGTSLHLELPADLVPRDSRGPWHPGPPFASWGVEATGWAPGREPGADGPASSAAWMRIPFHPLAGPGALSAVRWAHSHGVPVVACDPFASGRLAGRAPADLGSLSNGAQRPPDLRTLKAEWAHVLALGFLTESHRRQLPDAAWQFLAGDPRIAGIWFHASDVNETERIRSAARALPLSDGERARVISLMAGVPAAGGSGSAFK